MPDGQVINRPVLQALHLDAMKQATLQVLKIHPRPAFHPSLLKQQISVANEPEGCALAGCRVRKFDATALPFEQ
ncbi:hypothetical protein D3C87_2046100 [compost metagenome]